jgi:hypothetical protein
MRGRDGPLFAAAVRNADRRRLQDKMGRRARDRHCGVPPGTQGPTMLPREAPSLRVPVAVQRVQIHPVP